MQIVSSSTLGLNIFKIDSDEDEDSRLLNFYTVKISFFCFNKYHLKRNLDKLQQGIMHINIDYVIFFWN